MTFDPFTSDERYQFASGRNAYINGEAFRPEAEPPWRSGWRYAKSRQPLLHPELTENPP